MTGLDACAAQRLAVVPAGALAVPEAVVPMPGRWEADGDILRFTPRLPFVRGGTYALVEGAGAGSWTELARLQRPGADRAATTTVVAVHPTATEVPENLLRLSVTFSAPMDEGSAADAVHLVDGAGDEIPHALLPMPPELWDRPRRRLTLLLEPGRIKRGLVPNAALGAPLTHRTGFALVVDAAIRDEEGAELAGAARRAYRVGPPVRALVDPALWRVSWPTPGSRDALVVRFDRPLDVALALRCLTVIDGDGRTVSGRSAVDDGDVRWTFVADAPWPGGSVELCIDAALEDLAGNSVRRVFDRDLDREADAPVAVDRVILTPAVPRDRSRALGRATDPTGTRRHTSTPGSSKE